MYEGTWSMSSVIGGWQGRGRQIEGVGSGGPNSMQMPSTAGSHGTFLSLSFIVGVMGSHWRYEVHGVTWSVSVKGKM